MTNETPDTPTKPAPKTRAPRRAPADRKPPKPSEVVEAQQTQAELVEELLADLPELRPAHRFRLRHRNAFYNLRLDAAASGAFEGGLDFDLEKKEDVERFKSLQRFVESIDDFAESIAADKGAYELWAEGKTEEHFLALFTKYDGALGESTGSES